MTVEVRSEGRISRVISEEQISTIAQRMLEALRLSDRELSILLCDDKTIHALNRDYRRKDKPTDVLAFAWAEGEHVLPQHAHVLGDVVISIPTATRQAKAARRATLDEVVMLLAHGLLHLLGDDHPTRRAERRMTARTDLLRSTATAISHPRKRVQQKPRRDRSR
jgi:probable rRNA maturation factor